MKIIIKSFLLLLLYISVSLIKGGPQSSKSALSGDKGKEATEKISFFKRIIKSNSDPMIPSTGSCIPMKEGFVMVKKEHEPLSSFKNLYEIYNRKKELLGVLTVNPPLEFTASAILQNTYELDKNCNTEEEWALLCTLITRLIPTQDIKDFLESIHTAQTSPRKRLERKKSEKRVKRPLRTGEKMKRRSI